MRVFKEITEGPTTKHSWIGFLNDLPVADFSASFDKAYPALVTIRGISSNRVADENPKAFEEFKVRVHNAIENLP